MDEDKDMKEKKDRDVGFGLDADPGELKKAVWLEVMNQFNCKALSTWSSGDDRREKTFTHKGLGVKM